MGEFFFSFVFLSFEYSALSAAFPVLFLLVVLDTVSLVPLPPRNGSEMGVYKDRTDGWL